MKQVKVLLIITMILVVGIVAIQLFYNNDKKTSKDLGTGTDSETSKTIV